MRLINEDDVLEIIERVTNEAVDKNQRKYLIQPRIIAEIAGLPTIEAEPVKHGRWIPQGDNMWLCSNCKKNIIYSEHESDRTEKQRYCCRCGARMDGGIDG